MKNTALEISISITARHTLLIQGKLSGETLDTLEEKLRLVDHPDDVYDIIDKMKLNVINTRICDFDGIEAQLEDAYEEKRSNPNA